MALIKCPECQREISENATACPHCGNPIAASSPVPPKKAGGTGGFLLFCLGIIALIAIFGSISKDNKNASNDDKAAATPVTCVNDFHKCTDNADLVNHYNGISHAQVGCENEAERLAKYGTPKWPWFAFSSFMGGDAYPKTGIISLLEKDSQFSNAFGAMVHSHVLCKYDLTQKKVLDLSIAEN
jgi:hypothetical protein